MLGTPLPCSRLSVTMHTVERIIGAAPVPPGPCRGGSKAVTFGDIDGLSRKRGPDFLNGHAVPWACRVVVVTRCPRRVTAIPARRGAL
jgi:hypothetical protein